MYLIQLRRRGEISYLTNGVTMFSQPTNRDHQCPYEGTDTQVVMPPAKTEHVAYKQLAYLRSVVLALRQMKESWKNSNELGLRKIQRYL